MHGPPDYFNSPSLFFPLSSTGAMADPSKQKPSAKRAKGKRIHQTTGNKLAATGRAANPMSIPNEPKRPGGPTKQHVVHKGKAKGQDVRELRVTSNAKIANLVAFALEHLQVRTLSLVHTFFPLTTAR